MHRVFHKGNANISFKGTYYITQCKDFVLKRVNISQTKSNMAMFFT